MEKKTEADTRDTEKPGTPDEKRRRLTQAAIATPILGALASRPALGQGRQCSASVLWSGNTSVDIDYSTCGGCSPGFWLKAVFQNPDAHGCHLPCGVDENTTVAVLLGVSPTYPENDGTDDYYGEIRNLVLNRTISIMNADNKNDFRNDVKDIVGNNSKKNYADALFMFTRAAVAATLNAKTLVANFPSLADNPLPSLDTIDSYVAAVFDAADIVASETQADIKKNLLHASWDDTEETACSMFSNCNGSTGCGEL